VKKDPQEPQPLRGILRFRVAEGARVNMKKEPPVKVGKELASPVKKGSL
jgi:hypothetical protein